MKRRKIRIASAISSLNIGQRAGIRDEGARCWYSQSRGLSTKYGTSSFSVPQFLCFIVLLSCRLPVTSNNKSLSNPRRPLSCYSISLFSLNVCNFYYIMKFYLFFSIVYYWFCIFHITLMK